MRARVVRGLITVVQEHRFRLVDDEGVENVYVLAHDAPLEGEELEWLHAREARVGVTWTESRELIARVAHDVVALERRAGTHRPA